MPVFKMFFASVVSKISETSPVSENFRNPFAGLKRASGTTLVAYF